MPRGATGSKPVGSRTCGIRLPVITEIPRHDPIWLEDRRWELECDWESVGNRETVRQQVGLLF